MKNGAQTSQNRAALEPPFRDIFDTLPTALYITDAEGRVTYFNKAAEDLAGRTLRVGEDKWCVSWQLRQPDGSALPHDQCPMAIALKEGRSVRDIAVIAIRPDGTQVPVLPFPTVLRDCTGKLVGAVNMLVDISAMKSVETEAADRANAQAVLYTFTDQLYRADNVSEIYDAALESIMTGLRCSRASILLFDAAEVMQFVASRGLSAEYQRAAAGHSPWTPKEYDPQPIAVADFDTADASGDLKTAVRREGLRALAFVPLVVNGSLIGKFMAYHDEPHTFTGAEIDLALTIARQLGFAIERQRAREYHTDAESVRNQLSAIVENSDDAIVSKDLNGTIVSWNKGAQRLFGYEQDEIIGSSILKLIPTELRDEETSIITRIRHGERVDHFDTVRRHKNGDLIHVSLSVSPVKDAMGNIVGASKIARNIAERKHSEEQRSLLINELNHRVKNTLATVQSLAMQTLRNTERSEDARILFDSRLAALSRAHDLLTAQNWEGATLREVVDRAISPFQPREIFRVDGIHVRLSPKQALALSIALHELATNAMKYGALSQEGGVVTIGWTVTSAPDGERELRLSWTESGGPLVVAPTRTGFGSRLIERNLANELGGSAVIAYRPEGVVATIVSPLDLAGARSS